jgi:hypothetical protein
MESLDESPAYWRERAEQARATAECLSNPIARLHMMNCAVSYDRLARMAERPEPAQTLPATNEHVSAGSHGRISRRRRVQAGG